MKSTLISGFADWLGETRVFGEFLSFAIYGLLHRTLDSSIGPSPMGVVTGLRCC
jgi:hypothetical protein